MLLAANQQNQVARCCEPESETLTTPSKGSGREDGTIHAPCWADMLYISGTVALATLREMSLACGRFRAIRNQRGGQVILIPGPGGYGYPVSPFGF